MHMCFFLQKVVKLLGIVRSIGLIMMATLPFDQGLHKRIGTDRGKLCLHKRFISLSVVSVSWWLSPTNAFIDSAREFKRQQARQPERQTERAQPTQPSTNQSNQRSWHQSNKPTKQPGTTFTDRFFLFMFRNYSNYLTEQGTYFRFLPKSYCIWDFSLYLEK